MNTPDEQWFAGHAPLDGLRAAANEGGGQVFDVVARTPAVYTATIVTGFSPRQRNADWTWRWMGHNAVWTIVSTTAQPIVTTLDIELSAFHRARRLEVRLDAHPCRRWSSSPCAASIRSVR